MSSAAVEFGRSRSAGFAQSHRHQNAAIDALIERVIFAKSRADLVAATRRSTAAAQSLRCAARTHGKVRTARWDRFVIDNMPRYGARRSDRLVVGCATRRQGGIASTSARRPVSRAVMR
jgi:hypothetical protein